MLIVDVVDCVYSLPKKMEVGWVNGNPYYAISTFTHPQVLRCWAVHVSTPHATIYNTKEESLGLSDLSHTLHRTACYRTFLHYQNQMFPTPLTSEINTSDTPSMDQTQQTPHNQLNNPTLLLLLTILVLGLLDQVGGGSVERKSMEEDTNDETYNNPPQNFILQINKDLESSGVTLTDGELKNETTDYTMYTDEGQGIDFIKYCID